MNVLVVGSGGREHAFIWKILQSPLCGKVFAAPGNGGTEELATNLNLTAIDFPKLKAAILENKIGLVIIGPEEPLVKGLADALRNDPELAGLLVVGPDQSGARLEGSKDFSKAFMNKYGIPTARSKTFDANNIQEGYQFIDELKSPYVLKADGLAAGKGVIITQDKVEAKAALDQLILNRQFGVSSDRVLIEQFLHGIEVSMFVLTDGKDYLILPEAKDYKRIGEGDKGLNTGGMGAISPVIFADRIFKKKVEDRIIKPTIKGLQAEGMDYRGFIFIGLMNDGGEPYVIEYNVRMGDPETEVVLPRIKSDFLDLMIATADRKLGGKKIDFEPFTATTVMTVAKGYPEEYERGKPITFKKGVKSAVVFHAGTSQKDGQLVTNGGRVMAFTGLGKNMGEALLRSYEGIALVDWEGKTFRKDIGFDLRELGQ